MATMIKQQVVLDEALVPSTKRLRIRRSNFRLPSDIKSKKPTLQVVYDVLRRCPFFKAFLVTTDVPAIYMQEFWAIAYVHQHSIRFTMDIKKSIVDLEAFREMLHISHRVPSQSFDELPFKEEILDFLQFLGHSAQIKTLTDVNINKLFQPWRSFAALINKCLTGKSSGFDSFRDDILFSTIKVVSRHQNIQQYGVILPIELTTEDIKNTKAYKEYYAYATREAAPKPKATRATSPNDPLEVERTEAKHLKIVLRRSRQETHISQHGGSSTDEGTESGEGDAEETKSNEESADEETREEEEESFDPIPRTPEDSEDDGNGEEEQGLRVREEQMLIEEEEADELYREVDINQGRGLQVSQVIKDSHVTLTLVKPDGQQESSSVSSFVTSMLNSISDAGVESIFTTASSPIAPFQTSTPIMTPSTIATITTSTDAPIPPTTIPRATNQFTKAVSTILDRLQDSFQRENDEFLRTIDENMKKIIKGQVKSQVKEQVSRILPRIEESVNAQLEAEVLTRSSHSSRNSYEVVADLTEMELKKILMEKMEGNKSIQRSNEQRNLYKALVDAYEADKTILESYRDTAILKRRLLERSFLKTERALIDVYAGELTLRVNNEAVTFNFDQTLRYSTNYNDMTANRIDIIDMACEEYSDFFLEEVDAFLALEDEPTLREVDHSYYDPEGDILLLEAFLNDDPSLLPPNQGMYLPQVRKELKICEAKNNKSSIDEPPEVELKDLPPHLEYTFLEGDDKFPVIIAKDLSVEEKADLLKVFEVPQAALIKRHLEDFQLGVESYQNRLNLTKPDMYRSDFKRCEVYTAYSNPRGFIYQNKDKKNILMRIDELHKFSDGTLNDVRNALDDHLKGIRMHMRETFECCKGPYASSYAAKRRREGGEPESASTPSEPATRSASRLPVRWTNPHIWCLKQKKTLPAIQGSAQNWISELAKQADSRSSFNELLDTPIDFSNFIMNRLGVDTLTPGLLAGPTYELMRGSCTSLIELQYHMEEVYKATTDQLDWVNPEGQQYPHNLLQPLPLILDNRGRRVIPFAHFINNDLKYLRGGASSRKYTTSMTKTKAADYGHIKWIEDLFYGFAVNQESALDVYSKRRIIAVTDLKIVEWHNYKLLDWISVRRDDDKIYKFKVGDFKRLRLQDIEDMLLLLVQGKMSNLTVEERFAFNVSLRMFTRSIVIQRRVEDLQLGVKSYQKRLNLTKPDTLMRIDELYKFNDGMLNDVHNALDDRLKGIRMQYLPQTIWRKGDKDRAAAMIQSIDKMLKTWRIIRSLEWFVGGRLYEGDFQLLQSTI
nr:hypothetical protein [Tanacetum cinerariifolium]